MNGCVSVSWLDVYLFHGFQQHFSDTEPNWTGDNNKLHAMKPCAWLKLILPPMGFEPTLLSYDKHARVSPTELPGLLTANERSPLTLTQSLHSQCLLLE